MSNFTLFSLEKIKREAKKLKKKHPEFSHAQRLDLAAKQLLNVADYYQANSQIKNNVNSMCDFEDDFKDGFATCSYCNMVFYPGEPEDVIAHEERHLSHEKAEFSLGFLPAPYEVREKNKERARSDLTIRISFDGKVDAALRLIRTHFDRSLAQAIINGYWREHPTFDTYVAMVDDYEGSIPTDAMKKIREVYGKQLGHIAKGRSYWFPVTR